MPHTSGPWSAHDHGSHFQIRDEVQFPLAEVYGRSAFGRELCEGNAALIAAAPELLAALGIGWTQPPDGIEVIDQPARTTKPR